MWIKERKCTALWLFSSDIKTFSIFNFDLINFSDVENILIRVHDSFLSYTLWTRDGKKYQDIEIFFSIKQLYFFLQKRNIRQNIFSLLIKYFWNRTSQAFTLLKPIDPFSILPVHRMIVSMRSSRLGTRALLGLTESVASPLSVKNGEKKIQYYEYQVR